MPKHTYQQRQQIKQLVIETEVLRLQLPEALSYIKDKSGGLEIGQEHYYGIKRILKNSVSTRLNTLQHSRYAYLYQYFARIDEIVKYQQELWTTILTNPNDGYLKKACISELHQLTITLANLYEMLPEYSSTLAVNTQTPTENSSLSNEQDQSQRVFA
jgi:hypothetical protein